MSIPSTLGERRSLLQGLPLNSFTAKVAKERKGQEVHLLGVRWR
jgi:hypothetical protein